MNVIKRKIHQRQPLFYTLDNAIVYEATNRYIRNGNDVRKAIHEFLHSFAVSANKLHILDSYLSSKLSLVFP